MTRFLTHPTTMLRLEGGVLFALGLLLYGKIGGNWLAFALLLLVPDVSMVGYLRGNQLGARILRPLGAVEDEPWVILADPEGNEFCAFPP